MLFINVHSGIEAELFDCEERKYDGELIDCFLLKDDKVVYICPSFKFSKNWKLSKIKGEFN